MSIVKSFKYALEGTLTLISERNFRIHLVLAVITITAGWYYQVSFQEWIAIALCIALVLMAEGFNTAMEIMCDRITTNHDPAIKKIKDVSAASVLIMAAGAAIVGAIIFLPKIL